MKRASDRRKMTFTEHVKLGRTLKDLAAQMRDLLDCFNTTSPQGRILQRFLSIDGYISQAKNHMDNIVWRDYSDRQPDDVYYGQRPDQGESQI